MLTLGVKARPPAAGHARFDAREHGLRRPGRRHRGAGRVQRRLHHPPLDWNQRHKIRANQSFKIVKGEPRLVVDKSDFCLSFYFGDNLARQFIVAHGRGNNTPEGVSKVNGKTVDPDKAPYAGAQQQEMAERWIGFAAFGSRTGIGIHGTKYEESIPGETSLGCIRMFNRDVVELYRWVPHGAVIEIKA